MGGRRNDGFRKYFKSSRLRARHGGGGRGSNPHPRYSSGGRYALIWWRRRAPGSRRSKRAAVTVAVTLHLPGPLHHRIREDAESRGETVEAWLLAEARAIFEPEPDAETAALQAARHAITFPCFDAGGFGFEGRSSRRSSKASSARSPKTRRLSISSTTARYNRAPSMRGLDSLPTKPSNISSKSWKSCQTIVRAFGSSTNRQEPSSGRKASSPS